MRKLLTCCLLIPLPSIALADGPSNPWPDPVVMAPAPSPLDWTGLYVGVMGGQNKTTKTWTEIRKDIIVTETEVPVYGTCIDIGGHSGGDKCQGDHDDIDLTFGPNLGDHDNWTETGFYDADKVFLIGETVTIVDAQGNVLGTGTTVGEYASGTLYRLNTGETETVYSEEVVETLVSMTEKGSESAVGAFVGYGHDFGKVVGRIELGKLGDLSTAEVQLGFDAGRVLIYAAAGAGQYDGASGSGYAVGIDTQLGKSGKIIAGVKYQGYSFDGLDVDTATVRLAIKF